VAVDLDQNVYICDTENHRIVKQSAEGELSVIAGTGGAGFSGMAGRRWRLDSARRHSIAVDGEGNLVGRRPRHNRLESLQLAPPDSIPAPSHN
jgi:hypothetical protein